jgi:hypothetical protein
MLKPRNKVFVLFLSVKYEEKTDSGHHELAKK